MYIYIIYAVHLVSSYPLAGSYMYNYSHISYFSSSIKCDLCPIFTVLPIYHVYAVHPVASYPLAGS